MPDINLKVTKRSGEIVDYKPGLIKNAIIKAAVASGGTKIEDKLIDDIVVNVTNEVENRFSDFLPNVENIQDIVEKNLMRFQQFDIAKSYILYRAEKKKKRNEQLKKKSFLRKLTVKKRNGRTVLFNYTKCRDSILRSCPEDGTEYADAILDEAIKNVYDGISTDDIDQALILAASALIEIDTVYDEVASKLFMQKLRREVFEESVDVESSAEHYRDSFIASIEEGGRKGILDSRMLEFDLEKLSDALVIKRDGLLKYMGIQTLYERYLLKTKDKRLELPQSFWMRVSMGLALNEENKDDTAIEFYNTISSLRVVPSTPTLFHAGTTHPQLSSCYLTFVRDDLNHIFKCIADNAQLSKWSGGLGNDWSSIRGTGAFIKSTKVESQGVIPFLKIADSTTAAINRSGKRRGATCAYLETWHYDIEEFLDLRKNTGDDRRRTHDMNTANWIPDLFMKRVKEDGEWTLFSPDETPDLHEIYGKKFEEKYIAYEKKAKRGKIKLYKTVPAVKLWRKMLTMLFESGHPWVTFKDVANIRSPQDHTGIIHSSNLCVAPETLVLTDMGDIPIKYLENKKVKVWNGEQFSETQIVKTGVNQPLIRVHVSDGKYLDCTPYHKFITVTEGRIHASELKIGQHLLIFELPSIAGGDCKSYKVTKIEDLGRTDDTYCFNEPLKHAGVFNGILTGNCTEITLNTSEDEVAVCNLASINLSTHIKDGKLDKQTLQKSINTGIRMLDNVIDLNFYPIPEAKNSNIRHRPIGLGVMGFQDVLFKKQINFDSEKAVKLSDEVMEFISYHAIFASSKLAKEKGQYQSYKGSKWDRGIFPFDTIDMLEEERGCDLLMDRTRNMDWKPVYEHVKQHGMRNSNTMAIAPTATISNISGCFPCIEPIYKNIYVKANISGEFTIVNHYLVQDLKDHDLWDKEMLDDIKYNDGSLAKIDRIPSDVKTLYKEAFEIDPIWVIRHASMRAKWLDQSQSVNIFIKGASGRKLHETYMACFDYGLKTTYYLRTLAVSQIEKSTLDASKYGYTQMRNSTNGNGHHAIITNKGTAKSVQVSGRDTAATKPKLCRITDPDCEACQ